MKRIKIASIALALFFVALNSFTGPKIQTTQISDYYYRWFEYVGFGDPYDPSSYSLIMYAPDCYSSDPILCSVYAELDFWTWKPTATSLSELGISSASFTQPYAGGYGEIRLEDF